ncbi:hypothetical protein ACFQ1L_13030 [Phytohabitans flavus]|nr:hypothetical protein [Phytohabitans flavus]
MHRPTALLSRIVPFNQTSRLLAAVDRSAEGHKRPDDPRQPSPPS